MSQHNAIHGHPEEDVKMTEAKEAAGGSAAAPAGSKKPISMDAYHQLQQKRKQEQQQQQQQLQKQSQGQATEGHLHDEATTTLQPSLDALEQIVSMVQSTVQVMPSVQSPLQEVQLPGPDLANIIFGNSTQAGLATSMDSASITVATNGNPVIHGNNGNQSSGHSSAGPHRKNTSGSGSSVNTTSANNLHPRTTSPPTPASGSSGNQKNAAAKGPKAIHAIELIRIAGEILQFPPATVGTALIYYHKYRAYLYQSIKKGDRDNEASKADEYLFATACLHLASKCTEVSRKVRDLVNVTYRVMNPGQPVLSLSTKANDTDESSTDPASFHIQETLSPNSAPPPTATTYWHIRDSLLTTELMLLRILQFDLDVSLPFSDVLRIYKGMGLVFNPTDEEAAQLYPSVSNFDVFLPTDISNNGSRNEPVDVSSSSPNKYGTPASSLSTSTTAPGQSSAIPVAHAGIHPTLSALVQISITFCIDALCNSGIALQSSSRALAMGSIYLAVRSAQLELPMPFEDWCYAWGSPQVATSFGMAGAGVGSSGGAFGSTGGSSIVGVGGSGSNTNSSLGGNSGTGMNGIMGLTSTNSLFVSVPRPASSISDTLGTQAVSFAMDGIESATPTMNGVNGSLGGIGASSRDPTYSQTHSPLLSSSNSPALQSPIDPDFQQQPQLQQTIVDEVRKVVQELASFYTH